MQRSEAITDIRFKIGEPDANNSRFTDAQIGTELNRATKDVAKALKSPTRISTITSVLQQQEYGSGDGVPARIIDILEVKYDGKLLEKISYREATLRSRSISGTTLYQIPDSWYFRDGPTLGFCPVPNEAGKSIQFLNVYEPANISADDDTLPYTEESKNELVLLRTVIRLLAPNFKEEATYFRQEYYNLLTKAQIDSRYKEGDNEVRYIDD